MPYCSDGRGCWMRGWIKNCAIGPITIMTVRIVYVLLAVWFHFNELYAGNTNTKSANEDSPVPPIVSLRNGQGGEHFCSGCLISVNDKDQKSDIVITAAQCNPKSGKLVVVAGVQSLSHWSNGQISVNAMKKDYAVHNLEVSHVHTRHDISVVKLETALNFSEFIQHAHLPPADRILDRSTKGRLAGWGERSWYTVHSAGHLNQLEATVVRDNLCQKHFPTISFQPDSMICVMGQDGHDLFPGEAGGPFTVQHGDVTFLEGVVSVADKTSDYPLILTRVSAYVPWIRDQIKALSAVGK